MDDLMTVVDWSRWQFALTAIYHWLFVPLTLGLSLIVAVMESLYLKTKSEKWLAATKFWMTLFGINFAIGVATGIILEFEFGTNWSNYSWFVGDIFGAPLAIEGLSPFSWNPHSWPSCFSDGGRSVLDSILPLHGSHGLEPLFRLSGFLSQTHGCNIL